MALRPSTQKAPQDAAPSRAESGASVMPCTQAQTHVVVTYPNHTEIRNACQQPGGIRFSSVLRSSITPRERLSTVLTKLVDHLAGAAFARRGTIGDHRVRRHVHPVDQHNTLHAFAPAARTLINLDHGTPICRLAQQSQHRSIPLPTPSEQNDARPFMNVPKSYRNPSLA